MIFNGYMSAIKAGLILAILLVTVAVLAPRQVYAQSNSANAACESLGVIDGSKDCSQKSGDVNVNSGLKTALTLLSFAAGVIAVIMIMIAGLRYITSQGDSQKTSQAKNAIIYAAIGIVVVALAQLIIRFVIAQASPK